MLAQTEGGGTHFEVRGAEISEPGQTSSWTRARVCPLSETPSENTDVPQTNSVAQRRVLLKKIIHPSLER